MDVRIEHDSMGEVEVPAQALWRAQTQRAVDNFPISGVRVERELIGAIASIKGANAGLRAEHGLAMHPQVLLRVGRADDGPATRRRRLVDVLSEVA